MSIINNLVFLGIGAAFNPVMGNTSAWFVQDGKLFILDCGETVFERLWYLPELRTCEDIYVAITHLHNDHVGSLAALASACLHELGKKIHVIHPEQTITTLLALMGISGEEYFYHAGMPDTEVSFQATPVEHAGDMKSYGYIVKTNNWSFYFSGDARSIPGEVLERFYEGDIGFIYQDTSVEDAPNHAKLSYLERVIPEEMRGRVYSVHLEKDARGKILEKGFQIPDFKGDNHE